MRRIGCFANRNLKELLRDPLSLFFGVLFPIILLLLLSLINKSVPKEAGMTLFEMENLAPGIGVFSMSFVALFTAMLLSKDRESSFMLRLYTSPMTGTEFILGYLLPLVPLGIAQMLACYGAALVLGLSFTLNIFVSVAVSLPILVVNIAIGAICGTCLNEKAVGGICGALLTNLSAWLSGIWFDVSVVDGLNQVSRVLPFRAAVDCARQALAGQTPEGLWLVCVWAVGLLAVAVALFAGRMRTK